MIEELRTQRTRLESINRQKSRELLLKTGDQNSKFFHLSTIIRHRRNKINCIKEDESWMNEEGEIADYFKSRFEDLFASNHPKLSLDIDNLLWEKLTEENNNILARTPLKEEIKACIWSLHLLKSPSPDGFSGLFYRCYWNIVKD